MTNYSIKIAATYSSEIADMQDFLEMVEEQFTQENPNMLLMPLGNTPGPMAVESYNQMIEFARLFRRKGDLTISLIGNNEPLQSITL